MVRFRKIMLGCFGYAALAYLAAGIPPILFLIKALASPGKLMKTARMLPLTGTSLLLVAAVFFFLPGVLGLTSAIAWWKLKTGRPGAKRWAISASLLFLAASAILIAAEAFLNRYSHGGHSPFGFVVVSVQMLLGFGGLIAFGEAESVRSVAPSPSSPGVPGDCTSRAFDALVLVLEIGGMLALVDVCERWGWQQGLPVAHGSEWWIQWTAVIVSVVLIHESAHALFGLALGMKLRAFVVGPFQFQVVEGRWTFEFRITQLLAFSGAAGLVPVDPDQSRWNEVTMIAAGPVANLLTGAAAAAFAYTAPVSPWRPFWRLFALFAVVSLVGGVINLLPFRFGDAYSDGANILHLFGSSPAADFRRAHRAVVSTLVSPRRPRDYNIEAIHRASAHLNSGKPALLLRLWAMAYYIDTGAINDAVSALAQAEQIYGESASDIPARLHTVFVINSILLRRDSAAARQWWQRMQDKEPERLNGDYWLAKCAFHWAEGDITAAQESFRNGKAHVDKLPATGAYNFDRDDYRRMEAIFNDLQPLTVKYSNGVSDRTDYEIVS